jgi:hypothetical protein
MRDAEIFIVNGKRYRKPTMEFFSERDAPQLRKLREALDEAVENTAKELSRLMGFTRQELYTHAVPEALASLLDSCDEDASILAAMAYLESRGFKVMESRNHER